MMLREIPLNQLVVSKSNTRRDLNAGQEDSGIAELAASIREKGLLNPLLVRSSGPGTFEVIAGQRRLLACQRIGYDPVPCLVRDDTDDTDAVTLSLVENVHRADMSPLDKARALKQLYERHGTYERVAKETAWSASTVSKYIRLLDLPDSLQQRLSTKEGPIGVDALARLAGSFSPEAAEEVYDRVSGFSARIQEEIIRRSEGKLSRVDDLVRDAMEGAFEVRQCGGVFRCQVVRDILEGSLDESAFEHLVDDVRRNLGSAREEELLRDAARKFWRTLARGDSR